MQITTSKPKQERASGGKYETIYNKVITTTHNGDQITFKKNPARRPHMMQFATPGLGVRGCRGSAHSIVSPWVPISSQLTHMVYLLPFFRYLAGLQSVSVRPPDPDTMTNTALSSGNNG